MKAVSKLGDDQIKITFPFDYNTIAEIKTGIVGRAWDTKLKYWYAPLVMPNLSTLKKLGFTLTVELEKLMNGDFEKEEKNIKFPELKRKLFPFQEKGVMFLERRNGRGLIADEMGLGKTIQALAWLELHPERRPVLIVVPASLKLNWVKEIQLTLPNPGQIQILSGQKTNKITGDIVIINYDILRFWLKPIEKWNPKVVITDEAHYYKNNSSQRTKAVKKVARKRKYFIALSGTPIVSRPVEFYNVIHIISPGLFPNRWAFVMRYCGARNNGFGWDFSGASNTRELFELINNTVMIRRKKEDVLKELPAKIWNYVPIEINNWGAYLSAKNSFIAWLKETKGEVKAAKAKNAETLVKLSYLKQLSVEGKMDNIIRWIQDFLHSCSEKLVLFAIHRFVINRLMEEFTDISVKIDGSISLTEREKAVEKFQTSKQTRLFIGNIQAAGVGITLTAASNVVFIELPWTPGEVVQAADRCHRIGQKNVVNLHFLLAEKTIDMKMAKILDKKRKVIDNVLEGKDSPKIGLLSELIEGYI